MPRAEVNILYLFKGYVDDNGKPNLAGRSAVKELLADRELLKKFPNITRIEELFREEQAKQEMPDLRDKFRQKRNQELRSLLEYPLNSDEAAKIWRAYYLKLPSVMTISGEEIPSGPLFDLMDEVVEAGKGLLPEDVGLARANCTYRFSFPDVVRAKIFAQVAKVRPFDKMSGVAATLCGIYTVEVIPLVSEDTHFISTKWFDALEREAAVYGGRFLEVVHPDEA